MEDKREKKLILVLVMGWEIIWILYFLFLYYVKFGHIVITYIIKTDFLKQTKHVGELKRLLFISYIQDILI